MRRSTTLLFDVPAEVAFDYLADPTHRPEWQSSLRRVEVLDPGPAHDGQRWLDHTAVGLVAAMRTTSYDRATEWSETGTWRGIAADLVLRFEPYGSGCRVHVEFSVGGRGPWSAIGAAATVAGLPAVKADLAEAGRILSRRHHP